MLRQEAFLLAWWGVALATAFGWLPRARPVAACRLAGAGFIVAVGFGLAAVSWTASDELTLQELARLLGYGGVVTLAWTALGPATWRAAAAGLFVATGTICAIALATRLTPSLLPFDPIERALASQRLFQPLGYWNALAAFAAAAVAMGLAWSADGRRTAVRAAALAVTPVAMACLYLTYSRGGVIELIAGVAAAMYLCQNRRRAVVHLIALAIGSFALISVIRSQPQIATGTGYEGAFVVTAATFLVAGATWFVARTTRRLRRRTAGAEAPTLTGAEERRSPLKVAVAGLLVAVLITGVVLADRGGFGSGGDSAAVSSFGDPAARLTTTAGNRSAYWSEALRAFAEEPLRGTGPGTFRYGWARNGSDRDLVVDAHSLPLETLAEQGLVGGLALAVAFLGVLVVAGRGLRVARGDGAAGAAMASTVIVYLVAAGIDWMWEMTAVTLLGLGAAAVLGAAASTRAGRRQGKRPLIRQPGRLALIVVAIAAGAAQVPAVVATERTRDSEGYLSNGDVEGARDAADDAIAAAPWAASPYVARALVELREGDLDAAKSDARTATAHEPLEPAHLILLAQVARKTGDDAGAKALLRRALHLAPGLQLSPGAELGQAVPRRPFPPSFRARLRNAYAKLP